MYGSASSDHGWPVGAGGLSCSLTSLAESREMIWASHGPLCAQDVDLRRRLSCRRCQLIGLNHLLTLCAPPRCVRPPGRHCIILRTRAGKPAGSRSRIGRAGAAVVCRGAPRWLLIPCPALRDLSPRETDGAVRGGGSQACCHGCSSRAHSHPGAAAVAVSSVGTAPPSCIGDVSLSVSGVGSTPATGGCDRPIGAWPSAARGGGWRCNGRLRPRRCRRRSWRGHRRRGGRRGGRYQAGRGRCRGGRGRVAVARQRGRVARDTRRTRRLQARLHPSVPSNWGVTDSHHRKALLR